MRCFSSGQVLGFHVYYSKGIACCIATSLLCSGWAKANLGNWIHSFSRPALLLVSLPGLVSGFSELSKQHIITGELLLDPNHSELYFSPFRPFITAVLTRKLWHEFGRFMYVQHVKNPKEESTFYLGLILVHSLI